MKILTVKNVSKLTAIAGLLSGATTFASPISAPANLADSDVIGAALISNGNGGLNSTRDVIVNEILALTSANPIKLVTDGNHQIFYETANGDLFAGSVSNGGTDGSGTSVGAGFDVILAKYGDSFIAFYNADALATVIPDNGANIVMNNPGNAGLGLSGWTGFFVPQDQLIPSEGTPTPDGGATMLLLGGGVSALAFLRRKLS
jgi:hypothetical protein